MLKLLAGGRMNMKTCFMDCFTGRPWQILIAALNGLKRLKQQLSPDAYITAFALGCLSCGDAFGAPESVSAEPVALVRSAIERLRTHHINRAKVDWAAVEAAALQKVERSNSTMDAYAAIDQVIVELKEPHSFLIRPAKTAAPPTVSAPPPKPAIPVIKKAVLVDIGYIDLPTFAAGGEAATSFATQVRASMLELDAAPLCGWIIDLRSNEGGNMHAALLGLGAILGNGRLGAALGGPVPQYWHYRKNEMVVATAADIGAEPTVETSATSKEPVTHTSRQLMALPADSKEIVKASLPVAILLGRYTKSSGEGIAVSFIGRSAVRTFGSPTAGWASANIAFRLGGGELLVITYGRFADRKGVEHAPAVEPDVAVPSGAELSSADPNDATISAASQWIHELAGCPAERRPNSRERNRGPNSFHQPFSRAVSKP